jgi:hypothetical protein
MVGFALAQRTYSVEGAIPDTYFGMTIHHADAGSPWPSFPVHTMRMWDVVFWRQIQTSPTEYNWKKFDTYIDLRNRYHVADVLFTFGATPTWNTTNPKETKCVEGPGSCYPPANLELFKAFVTQLTQRYCGIVRYYEIWNEADSKTFWAGTPAELVKLAEVEYPIVKSRENCACDSQGCGPHHHGENPNLVLSPNITHLGAVNWLKQFMDAGGARYVDVLSFHGYGYIPGPEGVENDLNTYKETLHMRLPMWDTESNFMNTKDMPNPADQVSWMARTYLIKWPMGVSRYYWYAFDNGNWGTMWRKESGETEVSRAYANLQKWMVGATESCTVRDKLWVCTFHRPDRYVGYAVWSAGAPMKYKVPEGVEQSRDLSGKEDHIRPGQEITVTTMPVLLENKRAW